MSDLPMFYGRNREEWRTWLASNHDISKEVWLIFQKKHTGVPTVSYNDAVEEALCYGWIDSIVRRLDDERYIQKFTPRKPGSKWSVSNIARLKKLIGNGRMTGIGMKTVDTQTLDENYSAPDRITLFSGEIEKVLSEHPVAMENFRKLAPSHKKQYTMWIMEAKKEETRLRRLNEAIQMLSENKKLGLK